MSADQRALYILKIKTTVKIQFCHKTLVTNFVNKILKNQSNLVHGEIPAQLALHQPGNRTISDSRRGDFG